MVMHRHLILVGFMGTGKSTVGRLLAQRLHRKFVDVDDLIVEADGRSIPEIFSAEGEDGFRAKERAALHQALSARPQIIACGGGVVTLPENRQLLTAHGDVICLTASVQTIVERVQADTNRPLLAGPDREARIAALLEERAAAYATFPLKIATDGLSPALVVDRINNSLAAR